jgi:peptidyl-prolyl cis-trans isomerase D
MSVIQQIQEKYAKLMAIIIAVALMIFVVMLAFENGGRLFGGNSTLVGKVDGKSIEYADFLRKVDQQERTIEQQGMGSGPQALQQAVDRAWNDEVNSIIQDKEFSRVGISVGKKELGDLLYGANPPEDFRKIFSDSTGVYNGQFAKQQVDALMKMKPRTQQEADQRDMFIAFINYQQRSRLVDKYNSLFYASANVPKWFVEKQIADNSQIARLSIVKTSYADNADTTIKISDKEINDYVSKHEKDFKQDESRSITYVPFSTAPSKADTAATRDRLQSLKAEFDTVKNVSQFLLMQGQTDFADNYFKGSVIQIPVKDSIFALPINGVYGPYQDASTFSLAKLLAVRDEPEMVKIRHILIATAQSDPRNPGQMVPTKDTAVAKKLIDSIQTAIANGSRFDSLCVKFSDDNPNVEAKRPGQFNKVKIGIYDSVRSGQMVAEFNEFIFGKPVGSKGVVKTQFGYHYIEVLAHEGKYSKAYKIAYLRKIIEASNETQNNAANEASKFAGESPDQKSFLANADKLLKEKGINKGVAQDILQSSYYVGSLGLSRSMVRKIYDADLGQVLEPEKVGDNWVVAMVTEINKEGVMSAAKARIKGVEVILRNQKIAEKIRQKLGNVTTLEAAATALNSKVETIDSLRMLGRQTNLAASGLTGEGRAIGAAFNPSNKGKVVVVEGRNGVYVIRLDDISATSVASANVADERKSRSMQRSQFEHYSTSALTALREAASIKDRRLKFF